GVERQVLLEVGDVLERHFAHRARIETLPGMRERTVILYTFSKKFAMTGSRLGCAGAPKEIAEAISTMNTNDESCTTHYVQWAGISALQGPQGGVAEMLDGQPHQCPL
ncbi:aminotransferase class I/II-fold pyridoxal phosphate-dependent enzyme, partial [Mycobacterium tuberculosis]|nr:aminotransferase class I/II-fold pyridoxal phosphate-dependent enzyme [Mycobacterium tuberculosis]